MTAKLYYSAASSATRLISNICEKEINYSKVAKLFNKKWHKKYFVLDTLKMQIRYTSDSNFVEYKTIFLEVKYSQIGGFEFFVLSRVNDN